MKGGDDKVKKLELVPQAIGMFMLIIALAIGLPTFADFAYTRLLEDTLLPIVYVGAFIALHQAITWLQVKKRE
jgi:hypothetical protein